MITVVTHLQFVKKKLSVKHNKLRPAYLSTFSHLSVATAPMSTDFMDPGSHLTGAHGDTFVPVTFQTWKGVLLIGTNMSNSNAPLKWSPLIPMGLCPKWTSLNRPLPSCLTIWPGHWPLPQSVKTQTWGLRQLSSSSVLGKMHVI